MTVGERIRNTRKSVGMTQKELADKIGVTYVVVSQWENGRRNPKVKSLETIAKALDVPLHTLVGINPEVNSPENQKVADDVAKMLVQAGITIKSTSQKDKMDAAFDKLNKEGQRVAVERVEELAEIPKYQRQDLLEATKDAPEEKDVEKGKSVSEGAGREQK